MNFQDIDASASPEVQVNENFETIDYSSVYGKRQTVTENLNWGYWGGRWGGFLVAAGVLALTNTADNYVVVLRSNGVISVSTSATNWNNTLLYARAYKITTAGGVVTAVEDHRAGPGGIHGPIVAAELKGLTFTADTGSTADSDPGAGLFKWNNATQASATVLYFDDQTADGVSLTTLWGSLAETGFITLQQADDASKWQEWRWTGLPVDGTGYRKFTVTLQASGGSIVDDKLVLVDFESGVKGAVVGPSSPQDNQVARFDGTTGKLIQGSTVVVTDAGNMSGIVDQTNTGIFKAPNRTYPLMNYGGWHFDGSTNYLDSNLLTGITDTKKGGMGWYLTFAGAASGTPEIFVSTGNAVRLIRTSTGNIQVSAENAAGTTILQQVTTNTPCAAAGTYYILSSWDLAVPGSFRLYINDVAPTVTNTTFTDDTIDYTVAENAIGASVTGSGGSFLSGDVHIAWLDELVNPDFSVESVRRAFHDVNGVPVFLGRNGELPTGTAPIMFHCYDDFAQWPTNRGRASTSFTARGTPATVTTPVYGQFNDAARSIIKTVVADYTVARHDRTIINNRAATNTLTLPAASTCNGRELNVRTIQAQTVVSASSNVVPIAGGAAGTAILAATDGAWAKLVSDGANWQIDAGVGTA